jgi:hypothetical protein
VLGVSRFVGTTGSLASIAVAPRRRARERKPMRFLIYRASQGSTSKGPPCEGAVRGPEESAWAGEYPWYIEIASLEELMRLLQESGGGLGLFAPEEDEKHPAVEIFDDDEDEP